MEYCCHVWAGAITCYLELLNKLHKGICRITGPSLAASLKPLPHSPNGTSLCLFYRYYLVDIHLNLHNWFHVLILRGGLLILLIECMICPLPFLDVTRMSTSTVSFLIQLDSEIICL